MKLGGAAVATAAATAAAYKAYGVLNEKAKKRTYDKELAEELLHQNDYQRGHNRFSDGVGANAYQR